MSATPERFITVSDITCIVNGDEHDVGRVCATKIDLVRPTQLPNANAQIRIDTYSDDGEFISTRTRDVEILGSEDDGQSYEIRTVPVGDSTSTSSEVTTQA